MIKMSLVMTVMCGACSVDARNDWMGPEPRASTRDTAVTCIDGVVRGATLWLSDFITLELVTPSSEAHIIERRARNIDALRVGETFGLATLGLLVFQAWRRSPGKA